MTTTLTSAATISRDITTEALEQRAGYLVAGLPPAAKLAALDELAALPRRTAGGYRLALLSWLIRRMAKES